MINKTGKNAAVFSARASFVSRFCLSIALKAILINPKANPILKQLWPTYSNLLPRNFVKFYGVWNSKGRK